MVPSEQFRWMENFYHQLRRRWPEGDLQAQRDQIERLHEVATKPEDVTYAEADANGVPAPC